MATQWYERKKVEHQKWQMLKTAAGLTYYYNRETKEVTWDCPPELAQSSTPMAGEWFWIPDSRELFTPAKKVGPSAFQMASGMTVSLNPKTIKEHTYPLKHSSLERLVEDLVLLDDLHSPLILHNLKKRFNKDKIYTYIGTILIAINPYQPFPLYSNEIADEYQRSLRNFEKKSPHVFKVADDAFRALSTTNNSQSIIISGDSGSGKTEATKHCLRYLARISSTNLELSSSNSSEGNKRMKIKGNVEEKILMTNPILESFGNAKTIRNDNSSRFGKYIKIYFKDSLQIEGASIDAYLLEKIRVVYQTKGERNYHIFYQILSFSNSHKESSNHKNINRHTSNHEEIKDPKKITDFINLNKRPFSALKNKKESDFRILKGGDCFKVDTIDDSSDFIETLKAMFLLNFSEELINSIFSTLIAILFLGNIKFKEGSDDFSVVDESPESMEALSFSAELLGLKEEELRLGLTKRTTIVSGRLITAHVRLDQAEFARDALAKAIYAKMFYYLVDLVNEGISSSSSNNNNREGERKMIGVLDIFGFEIFQKNSLEQLCINYTNERLQQLFNLTTFKQEEELYASEGIAFESVGHWDNKGVIELIGSSRGQKMGLFGLIDEETKLPGGNVKDLKNKFKERKSDYLKPSFNKKFGETFTLSHYAGAVEYDPSEFLEKNNDTLMTNLLELVSKSQNFLVNKIFEEDAKLLKNPMSRSGRLKKSVCGRFNSELNSLMENLERTGPHYIRCIKPNDSKAPNLFSPRRAYEQLLYAGVFEAVKIRKKGFPFNSSIEDFCSRYGVVYSSQSGLELKSDFRGKDGCKRLIDLFHLNKENVRIGYSKVFYRSNEFRTLELKWSIFTEKSRINSSLHKLCSSIEKIQSQNPNEGNELLEELVKYILRAEELNFQNEYTKRADSIYEKAVESRMDSKTKAEIENCLNSKDETEIARVLAIIDKKRYRTRKCTKLRKLFAKLKKANAQLRRAVDKRSRELLEEALKMASEEPLKLNSNISVLYKNAEIYLQNIAYIEDSLSLLFGSIFSTASNEMNSNNNNNNKKKESSKALFEPILERANLIQFESENTLKAKLIVERILWIDQTIQKAFELLYEDVLKILVAAATEIRYFPSAVKKARAFLQSDPSSRRKDQLKAAVKTNDREREFWLTVEIKNSVLKSLGASFALSTFAALIGAEEWAKKYAFFGRTELAESYLKWTKKNIPHSLSVFNLDLAPSSKSERNNEDKEMKRKLNKLAIKTFKMIQIAMTDRLETKKHSANDALFFVIAAGVSYPAIRDEIFVQVLKQLTQNPSSESKRKGLNLLKVCMSSFPPSEEFQSFLEGFIINNIKDDVNTFLYILHYKAYHAEIVQRVNRKLQRLKVPTAKEIESVLKSSYANDIQEPLPHKIQVDLGKLNLNFEHWFEAEKASFRAKGRIQNNRNSIVSANMSQEGNEEERETFMKEKEGNESFEEMSEMEDSVPLPPIDEVVNEIAVPDAVQDQEGGEEVGVPDISGFIESEEGEEDGPPPI